MHVWLALAAEPSVAVVGVAHDAKAGAVVVGPTGEITWVDGLPSWPDALRGLPVTVTGRKVARAAPASATVDADGAISQGTAPDAPLDMALLEATWAAAPWELSFADGNQNLTVVAGTAEATTWSYQPVQPHESSSGHYSGGEPARGAGSSAIAREVWARATRLLDDPTVHVERREMGTGRLQLTAPWGRREVLLSRAATAELQGALATMRAP